MIAKIKPGEPVGRKFPPIMPLSGAYPLTSSETAILNYLNTELQKIDVQLKEIRRVMEQIRDEARQREKN